MEPDYWERLRDPEIFRSLAGCINFDFLKDSLVTKKILTAATADDIQGKVELDERNQCLLQCLLGGIAGMYVFVWVLLANGMDRAVKLLKANADALPWSPTILQPASCSGSRRELRAFGGSDARLPTRRASSAVLRTVGETRSAGQQVARATHLMQGDNIYNMVRLRRGKCIIINNRDFGGLLETRHGSDVDMNRMMWLFSTFLFECEVHRNLKAEEMKEVFRAAAESEQQWSPDCLVVVLMSHGYPDIIFGTDGEPVYLHEEVYRLFNNINCPGLQGKPKLFFVQASRGGKGDNGTYARSTSADALPRRPSSEPELLPGTEAVQQKRSPSFSDMYIVYATMPGYVAMRNPRAGSWLLSAVYSVFSEHACDTHLEEMMHLVHDEVLKRNGHDGARMTPCVEVYGWTKLLYFNPGGFV